MDDAEPASGCRAASCRSLHRAQVGARQRQVARIGADQETSMPLLNVVLTLVVVGVLLWLVNTYVPMDAKIKRILNAVVVIATVVWVVNVFGLLGNLANLRVGKH
jgi:hypothetical protein